VPEIFTFYALLLLIFVGKRLSQLVHDLGVEVWVLLKRELGQELVVGFGPVGVELGC
jgi:hypothetical protein